MRRCIQLARLWANEVAPNPMVGAVLVHENRIIGEGYHQRYGRAHAEVNCIASVAEQDQALISDSTLYVSLEPCSHWGKTPPCADLIIEKKIPEVIIGCRDPFAAVNGKGIEKLKAAGIKTVTGILEEECRELNKRFFTFHQRKRPYVILKWAQTLNGKMAHLNFNSEHENTWSLSAGATAIQVNSLQSGQLSGSVFENSQGDGTLPRLLISNEYTNRIVHKWRSEETAIVIGTNTALYDNPQLNTRHWPGKNPIRIVIDRELRLPPSLHVFDGSVPTIIFNKHRHNLPVEKTAIRDLSGVHYFQLTGDVGLVQQLLNGLYNLDIQSILVEGGAQLLQSFIDANSWEEARVITNEQLVIEDGLAAPQLTAHKLQRSETIFSDVIRFYRPAVQ